MLTVITSEEKNQESEGEGKLLLIVYTGLLFKKKIYVFIGVLRFMGSQRVGHD